MVKITSINEFIYLHEADKDLENAKKKSRIYNAIESQWQRKCQILKNAQKGADATELLQLEVYILTHDLEKTSITKELKASATQALQQYTDAQHGLVLVKNSEEYQKANLLYSRKTRDSSQLPQDACRQFIRSQIARLSNKLTNDLSEGEIQYISLRRDNMYCAEKLYKEMQKQALGIPLEQKKGLTL